MSLYTAWLYGSPVTYESDDGSYESPADLASKVVRPTEAAAPESSDSSDETPPVVTFGGSPALPAVSDYAGPFTDYSTPSPNVVNFAAPPPVPVMSYTPVQGDPRHSYVRTDAGGDLWTLTTNGILGDEAGTIIIWYVLPGHDSREIIPGTYQNLGPVAADGVSVTPSGPVVSPTGAPGTGSTAPGNQNSVGIVPPVTTTTGSTPVDTTVLDFNHIADAPGHKYDGSSGLYDFWKLDDGVNVVRWAVLMGHDSRELIPGTFQIVGPSATTTTATAPQIASAGSPTGGLGGGVVNGNVGGAPVTNAPLVAGTRPADAGPISDPRHKYVGRDARGDVYQLYDPVGGHVIEWAVRIGDPSASAIAGSQRDIGPPNSQTIAQRSDYTGPTPAPAVSSAATPVTGTSLVGWGTALAIAYELLT